MPCNTKKDFLVAFDEGVVMTVDIEVIEGGDIDDLEFSGEGEELGFGHTEEIACHFGREVVSFHAHFAEGTQSHGAAYILGGCDLFEVTGTIIEDITVEMVDLHAWCARSYPCLIDEVVAMFVAEMAHLRISATPFAVKTASSAP